MPSLTAEIAATAARIIIDSELTDWRLARRKALEQLAFPSRGTPLPTDEQIIEALLMHQRLFGGAEHAEQLRAQRESALEVMEALAQFSPRLTGAVAEGWAHAGSDIRIELTCPSEKLLDYALIDLGVSYTVEAHRDGSFSYRTEDADWPVRLVVSPLNGARARPRGTSRTRQMDLAALRRCLASGEGD
ncbi:MAG: hypothetical protein ACK4XK_03090 [Casimicrobiaceae bacterium]